MLYNSGARPFHDIIMKILNNWVAIQRNPPSVRKLYGVLLSGDFVSVAETLIKAFPLTATIIPEQSTHTVRSIRSQVLNFEVPPSPFIGPLTNRTKEMVQLIDHFKFNRRAVVVTGPTSVGKTSLVAHFAATEFDGSCIWIDAKNSATFTNSFSRLAAKLEISPDLSAAKILEKVYTLVSNRPIMFVFDSISSPQLETEITQLIQIFNEYPQPYPFFVLLTRSSKMFSTISDRVVLNALEYVKCFTIIYALVETICGLGYLVVGSYGMQMYNDGSFRTRILTSSIVAGVTMLIHQVLLIVWRKVERKNDDKNVRHGKIFRIFSILMIIIIFAALIVILLDAWTYVFADDEDEAYVILTVLMHISNITVVEYFIYLLFTSCIMLGPCFKVCF
ncbi:uncharacterized protein LOC110861014 [Folsomia candida]|uniref:uncharacterized protein LOC110861014 n=1 Tax=Folsomia candida TaxID=158441 RepID=UPI001604A444|nr:uncharacterized protein LOC110861014 [Folsomia candida]